MKFIVLIYNVINIYIYTSLFFNRAFFIMYLYFIFITLNFYSHTKWFLSMFKKLKINCTIFYDDKKISNYN